MKHKGILQYFILYLVVTTSSCIDKNKNDKDLHSNKDVIYKNPLNVKFGDPYILDNGDGNFYMYGTGGGAMDGFSVYSSTNLVDWKYEKQVFHGNTINSWSISAFWAPEVYKFNGKYYLFYSANWKYNPKNEEENFHIGVAVSDNPTGPFKDIKNKPLFEPGYPIIDANVFRDDDGKYYLYYSRACYKHPVESEIAQWAKDNDIFSEIEESWVYGVELSSDFSSVIGEPVLLLQPPLKMDDKNSEWESRSVTSKEINRRWTEGSFTFKKNDIYYIMYSANHYAGENYAVGYASSKSPLGPFVKSDKNPILEKNTQKGGDVTGTGHNSVLFLDNIDKMYCVYHGRTTKTGEERVVFIDEMEILPDGSLQIKGPSTSPKKLKLP
ncbi:MAG: family 43 glycosylhydrolase [Flavobacteriales bacterium]|nr:family 43 glycosylhydrolase [Flavobacteriales bacterium]NCQ11751.1 family 43 glycosylhydrolase [Bacteroidota bacterium]PIV92960.1 MAG: glycoside hydrolase [Flavobacteriaceae bacterium CG17_big_fil_post_rev_8_21_14_2_50_33_15]NCP59858.1 family 43 glycosylhydrolase [Flavobacteriales bacterium]NCQ58107.1 family 43 glycosylhydrolase [Flavobacteriales bacterium]